MDFEKKATLFVLNIIKYTFYLIILLFVNSSIAYFYYDDFIESKVIIEKIELGGIGAGIGNNPATVGTAICHFIDNNKKTEVLIDGEWNRDNPEYKIGDTMQVWRNKSLEKFRFHTENTTFIRRSNDKEKEVFKYISEHIEGLIFMIIITLLYRPVYKYIYRKKIKKAH